MARVFIGVGSNIEPERNLRAALRLLGVEARIAAISTVYRTRPLGRPDQPPFYNCVVELDADLAPAALRAELRRIEAQLGRQRSEDKYAPRTIDLDLIVYDDLAVGSDELVLPDPQIAQRPFLALPLQELAPELALAGRPIGEIAAALREHDMQALPEYTRRLREDSAHGS